MYCIIYNIGLAIHGLLVAQWLSFTWARLGEPIPDQMDANSGESWQNGASLVAHWRKQGEHCRVVADIRRSDKPYMMHDAWSVMQAIQSFNDDTEVGHMM